MARLTWLSLVVLAACSRGREEPPQPAPAAPEPPAASPDETPSEEPGDGDAIEPEPQGPPPDYGHITFTDGVPDPERLTHHAVAGYVVVAVYDQPDMASRQLGYIRLGTRMKVTAPIEGDGCPSGWHGLSQGGYACASKGLVVDKRPPYMPGSPPSPALDHPIPYQYAFVRRWNTPMWWRIPTKEEQRIADQMRTELELARQAAEQAAQGDGQTVALGDAAGPVPARGDLTATDDPTPQALPSLDDQAALAAAGEDSSAAGDLAAVPDPSMAEVPAEEPVKLPLSPERAWLERGFFLSIGEKVEGDGESWWRTARGAYVDTKATSEYTAKDHQGTVLDGIEYPFGFVMADDVTLFELEQDDRLRKANAVERRTFLDLEERTEIRGTSYFLTKDGLLVKEKVMRLVELQPRPPDLQPWERWIDVSLSKQILVAYEGDEAVFVTLVSTGKKGTEEEPFETPTGRWRIRSKHISTTMDGNTASDGNYSIQDVPWAMFFDGSYALHGAFWHAGFGYRRSHGCVNLGPSDARWLFFWTTPYLPNGWHGVHANESTPGTTVIVRE